MGEKEVDTDLIAAELKRKYHKEYQREWRKKNREKFNEYHRKWRKANPHKCKEYQDNYWKNKARGYANE